MFSSHYKFLIVGAGISGLRAGQVLAENQQDFLILQADNRIGGRICTLTIGQALAEDNIASQFQWLNQHIKALPVQCGATWLSQEQPTMHKIVKDLGLNLFTHYYEGSNILALRADSHSTQQHSATLVEYYTCPQILPKVTKLLASLQQLEKRFNFLSSNQKNGVITEEQKAELDLLYQKYDSTNAYDFILQKVEDEFLAKLLSSEAATLNCAKSEDYSVLTLMTEDGFENIKFYVGAQGCTIDGFRLKEGMSTIVNKIKNHIQQLTNKNKKGQNVEQSIRLNSPVAEIHNDCTPVKVITVNGEVFSCEKVIMAVPIATMHKIKISSISKGKQFILQNQLMGSMTRQAMVFKQPFWRKLNISGYVSFSHEFAMNELVDLTPPDGQCGILGFVFTADGWDKWKEQIAQKCQGFNGSELKKHQYQVLQKQSCKILADLFLNGDVEHEHFKQMATFTRSMSARPYIAAAYQAIPALGVYKQVNALGEDLEDARFSDEQNMIILGSDFSTEFRGYMEGAVRVANRKISRLLGLEAHHQSS